MHALLQQWKGLQWLLLFVLLGTSMVIGDGVLTPALSSRTNFFTV
jgi:KUP system potassium uptake protein